MVRLVNTQKGENVFSRGEKKEVVIAAQLSFYPSVSLSLFLSNT